MCACVCGRRVIVMKCKMGRKWEKDCVSWETERWREINSYRILLSSALLFGLIITNTLLFFLPSNNTHIALEWGWICLDSRDKWSRSVLKITDLSQSGSLFLLWLYSVACSYICDALGIEKKKKLSGWFQYFRNCCTAVSVQNGEKTKQIQLVKILWAVTRC